MHGLGFIVQMVQDFGFRVQGFRVWDLGFKVRVKGFLVYGSWVV